MTKFCEQIVMVFDVISETYCLYCFICMLDQVDEDEDVESSVATPKKRKVASKSYDSGRKKHNTT